MIRRFSVVSTLGLAARMVKPSGLATLNTLLVASRWAAPGICCKMTGGLPGMYLPKWWATISAAISRLPLLAPIRIVTALPS